MSISNMSVYASATAYKTEYNHRVNRRSSDVQGSFGESISVCSQRNDSGDADKKVNPSSLGIGPEHLDACRIREIVEENKANGKIKQAMSGDDFLRMQDEIVRNNAAESEKNEKSTREIYLEHDPNAAQKQYRIEGDSRIYSFDEFCRVFDKQMAEMKASAGRPIGFDSLVSNDRVRHTRKITTDISDYKKVETADYKIVPLSSEPYVDIYDKSGNKLGAFAAADLKAKVDPATGKELLISSHGTISYDVLPITQELKEALCSSMGVDRLESEELQGYSIKTHAETGIQYVLRDGEEGRGGRVLIQSETDKQRFEALAQKYMNKYPNLITDANAAAIYADLEIRGLVKSTETGIVTMGWNGVSYDDNNDPKKNWAMQFTEDVFKRIDEWIKNHRNFLDEADQISSWNDLFGTLGAGYERVWSDEELKQGYLNQ